MKITDEMIKQIEFDPYDEWDTDIYHTIVSFAIVGFEQDVRDFFDMQAEDWPDSYVNLYISINPITEQIVDIETHIVDGLDGRHDKGETIKVSKAAGKKILRKLKEDKTFGSEFIDFIREAKKNIEENKRSTNQ